MAFTRGFGDATGPRGKAEEVLHTDEEGLLSIFCECGTGYGAAFTKYYFGRRVSGCAQQLLRRGDDLQITLRRCGHLEGAGDLAVTGLSRCHRLQRRELPVDHARGS